MLPQNAFTTTCKERLLGNRNIFIAYLLLFYSHQVGIKQSWRAIQLFTVSHTFSHIFAVRKRSTQFKANSLRQLVFFSSVKYLTLFRRVTLHDYSSVSTIVACDYEALYVQKCGLYEKCLQLSEEKLYLLSFTDSCRIASVLRLDESDSLLLMDGDCLSLIGLARLCDSFDVITNQTENVHQTTMLHYLSAWTL